MPSLVGITGYSGAGKTTAINYLVKTCAADRIYVGQLVTDEVARLGMPPGPESERTVRKDLRDQNGMEGLAMLVAPAIRRSLDCGKPVIIDAVCCLEEMGYYRGLFEGNAPLISIVTSFDIRADRLITRAQKPMTAKQLTERDELENTFLRTDLAIQAAAIAISNDSSLDELYHLLDEKVRHLVA